MARLRSNFISMDQMYLAYGKAKVDVFFERSQPTAVAFCEFEKSLENNLKSVAARLITARPTWFKDRNFIGGFECIPKGLIIPDVHKPGQPHFSSSDPVFAWNYLLGQCSRESGQSPIRLEFRPVAQFTVDMHVVCRALG